MVDGILMLARASGRCREGSSSTWTRSIGAAPHIFALAEAGIVRGVGGYKFAPSAAVTRGTFVTIIGRICGVDAAAYTETGFADTDISQWYGPYVAWAAGAGLVLGDGEKFYPDAAITREQMAVIIVRLAGYLGLEAAPGPEGSRPYADAAAVSPWARRRGKSPGYA
jgi:hypothetical protein